MDYSGERIIDFAKWIEDPVTKVNAVSDKQAKSMMRSFKSGRL